MEGEGVSRVSDHPNATDIQSTSFKRGTEKRELIGAPRFMRWRWNGQVRGGAGRGELRQDTHKHWIGGQVTINRFTGETEHSNRAQL